MDVDPAQLADLAKPIVIRLAAGGIQALLTRRAVDVDRAIQATSSDFPGIEGTEIALQRLVAGEGFTAFLARVHAGHRDTDEATVKSFIDEGDFFLPDEDQQISVATEIISLFIRHLANEFYKGDDSLVALANRHESMHVEIKGELSADKKASMDKLETMHRLLQSIQASVAPPSESTDSGVSIDESDRNIAKKIDFARDLISRGLNSIAREELRQIQREEGDLPPHLEFRVITNLGACALAEEDNDLACELFDKAYHLQPANEKAIVNAALSAYLRGHSDKAIELAARARSLSVRNSSATAVLIRSYCSAEKWKCIEDLLANEQWVIADRDCGLTLAMVWMQLGQFEKAIRICESLVEADSQDTGAILTLSQCLLNATHAARGQGTGLTADGVNRLFEAEAAATRSIDLLQQSEHTAQRRQALLTRAIIRRSLGSNREAMGDIDEVLREAKSHGEALFHKGILLFYAGRLQDARHAFESLQDSTWSTESKLILAHVCVLSGDSKEAITILEDRISLDQPDWEMIRKAEVLSRAELDLGQNDSVGPLLETAMQQQPHNPRLMVLAAWRCSLSGDMESSENWFLRASEHADGTSRPEILLELGDFYQKHERFAEAAAQYAEVVNDVALHPAALALLICLVNSGQLREALRWGREIRKASFETPRLAIEAEAEILERVGDLSAAVLCRQELCSREDSTAADRVNLASVQFRCGDRQAALDTVRRIRATEMIHDPQWILQAAKLKFLLGEEDYLNDMYVARRFGLDHPDIQQSYVQMFVHRANSLIEPETIGPGCAVLLRSELGDQWWHLLSDEEEIRGPRDIHLESELAQKLSGRRVGDTVLRRQDLEELTCKVIEVQSKFVRAFQETLEEFSTRFPGNTAMSRVNVEDGDFTKLFYTVDRRHQFIRDADRAYLAGQLPFVSFASLLGLSTIEVWTSCTVLGETPIRFGMGTSANANEDADTLKYKDGIILDMLALLTAHRLDLSEHLRSGYRRVAIPQHVVDELHELYGKAALGPPKGHLGKGNDGKYILTEISEDEWKEWLAYVCSLLELAESFDRVASFGLLDAEDTDMLFSTLTHAGVGSVYAGDEVSDDKLILVSDDLGLSSVARHFGIKAVNTQSVLEDLRRRQIIKRGHYSSLIERLIMLNYRYVRVHPCDIVSRLAANDYVTTEGTREMIKTLEGPDCSEESALSVGAEVVTRLAREAPPRQTEWIMWSVLAALRQGREMTDILFQFREVVKDDLTLFTLRRNQLVQTIDAYIRFNSRSARASYFRRD